MMEKQQDRELAEFFAKLVNIPDLQKLSPEKRAALQEEFNAKLVRHARLLKMYRTPLTSSDYAIEEVEIIPRLSDAEVLAWLEAVLPRMLRETHRKATRTILGLLDGKRVVLSTKHIEGQLQGRVVEEAVEEPLPEWTASGHEFPRKYVYPLSTELYSVVRLRPFPFGRCPVCQKVFVHPHRGKPRRYCSIKCKAKGIPAAANQTEYVRRWRHKKREAQELTRRILQRYPDPEQYRPRLKEAFPQKSEKQLRALIEHGQHAPVGERKETA